MEPKRAAFAVITPKGELSWYGLDAEEEVRRIVSHPIESAGTDEQFVVPGAPVRAMCCDVALVADGYERNQVAEHIIIRLSGGRVTHPWAGTVALCCYGNEAGEWTYPVEMPAMWQQRITAMWAHAAGQPGHPQ